jgi:hypothetical protein
MYKTKLQIDSLSKEDFIEYARDVNIFKAYDFKEFLEVKQHILDKLPEHNLSLNDITPVRTIKEVLEVSYSYNKNK